MESYLDTNIFETIDNLFEKSPSEAEEYMRSVLEQAKKDNKNDIVLRLYNELIGYYRMTSKKDRLLETIEGTKQLLTDMRLEGTINYATTVLNMANAYRSIGEYEQAKQNYIKAQDIYNHAIEEGRLDKNDICVAGLYNNMSLLHQELGEFKEAENLLKNALLIVVQRQDKFEIAVTYANLANTMLLAKDYDKAFNYAREAIRRFKERNCIDAHYCAALSALATCYYNWGQSGKAKTIFEEAMRIVENTVGRNSQYERLKESAELCGKEAVTEEVNKNIGTCTTSEKLWESEAFTTSDRIQKSEADQDNQTSRALETFHETLTNSDLIRLMNLAEDVTAFSQTTQPDKLYNITLNLYHHMMNVLPTRDTELINLLEDFMKASETGDTSVKKQKTLEIGAFIATRLYEKGDISDIDPNLGNHAAELMFKASIADYDKEELVNKVVRLEFKAFDEVKNEGGRASCQNNWPTFYVMRKSQYLTWNRDMLTQYLYDFSREYEQGHNLITEKYGRMMESTAPEKYEEIKGYFPELSEQKKAIIEQIVALQVGMTEEFGKEYPTLAGNARSFHSYEDNSFNTSSETYLRGEISTYSDKMLQLYAGFVVDCVRKGINITKETISNTAILYGYSSLKELEEKG